MSKSDNLRKQLLCFMKNLTYNYVEKYLDELLSSGRMSFSLQEMVGRFPQQSANSLRLALNRQVKKQKIVSFFKGYYLIITPEYQNRGILPIELFVEQFFRFLNRSYYVSLLSAASYYGAAHHQVMESFVCIKKPPLRKSESGGLIVNYLVKSDFPEYGIVKRKTDNGFISISSPELTAVDLVLYYKQVGGLNRVAEVLYELADQLDPSELTKIIENSFPISVLQRFGYLLENLLKRKDLAETVYQHISKYAIYPVALQSSAEGVSRGLDVKWQIIENYTIEAEAL